MFMVYLGGQRTGGERGKTLFSVRTRALCPLLSALRRPLRKAWHELEAGVHQPPYGIDGFFQHRPLGPIEFDLHDPLDALSSDHDGDAHIEVPYAEFAIEVGGAGQDPLLVAKKGLRHGDRRRGRSIERRTGFQQVDDFGPPVAGSLDDLVDPRLGRPPYTNKIRQRNAGNGRIPHQRHHGVAMATEHEGSYILNRNVEFLSEEITETR